jgi:hypothetical protein
VIGLQSMKGHLVNSIMEIYKAILQAEELAEVPDVVEAVAEKETAETSTPTIKSNVSTAARQIMLKQIASRRWLKCG